MLATWPSDEQIRVRVVPSFAESLKPSSKAHRVSPIHPLVEETTVPDTTGGTFHVHFLVVRDPFRALGRISRHAYPGLATQTWFGIGLASIIIFSSSPDAVQPLYDDPDVFIVAHEIWKLEKGILVHRELRHEPTPTEGGTTFELPSIPDTFPADLAGIIEEFACSFAEHSRWVRLYSPDELPRLNFLFDDVQNIVTDLLWLTSNRKTVPPEGLRESDLTSSLERSRLVQQRSDRLVQINSALSYVISQAFFGAPPVLTDSPLIQRHSLLGVGRAHRALLNLVREIEMAFRSQSIPKSVCERWKSFPKLADFDGFSEPNSTGWKQLSLPDVLLEKPADPDPFKLPYFSGRLGFRESEYSVSAAIHSLTSGDAGDWHLSTMTHEMLHGHVRDVLHSIFDVAREDEPENLDQFWEYVSTRFQNHMLGRPVKDFALIDSARSLLLSYCCLVREFGSLTHVPIQPRTVEGATQIGKMWVPDKSIQLKRLLAEEDRSISEIIVHCLDLFYFYFDNFDLYSRAVWSSWRTVPVVLRDVRQYVLRMLLAYTSTDSGSDIIPRFARARNQVREGLKQLNSDFGGDAVLERAIELLNIAKRHSRNDSLTAEGKHPLFRPFFAAVRVADFARHCLASERIQRALFKEDFVTSYTGERDFDLDFGLIPGEFSDRKLRSVAEFTAWRARSGEPSFNNESAVERRTAWLFIACGALK